MVCMSMQFTQSNYNLDSNTKSLNYIKVRFKALIYFGLEKNFELKPLRIRPQLNLLQISVTSN